MRKRLTHKVFQALVPCASRTSASQDAPCATPSRHVGHEAPGVERRHCSVCGGGAATASFVMSSTMCPSLMRTTRRACAATCAGSCVMRIGWCGPHRPAHAVAPSPRCRSCCPARRWARRPESRGRRSSARGRWTHAAAAHPTTAPVGGLPRSPRPRRSSSACARSCRSLIDRRARVDGRHLHVVAGVQRAD